ncbi:exosortase C-terminal domain/associated protein EpsI [Desulfopila sp. IMCC35008]|uniref:exosortase C-terminal domain/associated protein EpsI n=1 Tax=Desulfopila sp. IMCC35008 TaxID=2653858 RepID=UPI0013CF7212|nr:exosortase C-terminal domain/associated protein EpsI [Desulfopila sp. IMCC35008]
MYYIRKTIILTTIFILVALLTSVSGVFYKKIDSETNYLTKNLPVTGWNMRPIPSDIAVIDTLQANTTLFADYYHSGEKYPVNLYVGYYNKLEKSKFSHAPQVCFTAQGWVLDSNDKVKFNLGTNEVTVNRLILDKGPERILVYFWYQDRSEIYADLFRMKLSLAGRKLLHGSDLDEGNAFIRLSTTVSVNENLTEKKLQSFANDIYNELPKLFDNKL